MGRDIENMDRDFLGFYVETLENQVVKGQRRLAASKMETEEACASADFLEAELDDITQKYVDLTTEH